MVLDIKKLLNSVVVHGVLHLTQ